jgi:hypothetical protein
MGQKTLLELLMLMLKILLQILMLGIAS